MKVLSINDDYHNRIQRAIRNGWRCNKADAALLSNYAVERNEIEPDQRDRMVRHLENGDIMRRNNGQWVCTTCGGNCGQCGMTDFIGNPGFSFDRIVAGLNPPGKKPVDQEAAFPTLRKNKLGLAIIGGYVAIAFSILVIVAAVLLTGCASTPAAPPCTSCVGPYDLTLSSHRDAVLGRP